MIPTGEIRFGCHVTLVLKVIDLVSEIYYKSSYTSDKHVIFVFFHPFSIQPVAYLPLGQIGHGPASWQNVLFYP